MPPTFNLLAASGYERCVQRLSPKRVRQIKKTRKAYAIQLYISAGDEYTAGDETTLLERLASIPYLCISRLVYCCLVMFVLAIIITCLCIIYKHVSVSSILVSRFPILAYMY